MCQHHALWLSGRARCVDYRRQIGRLDACKRSFKHVGIDLCIVVAPRFDIGERDRTRIALRFAVGVEEYEFLQLLDALDSALGVFPQLFARYKEHPCTGIFEDKSYLFDGLCRIDRHIHSPQRQYCEIDKRPFRPVLRNDRHAVARLYAESGEARRDAFDTFDHLNAVQIVPNIFDLVGESVPLIVPPKRLKTKMRYRLRNVFKSYEIFSGHRQGD